MSLEEDALVTALAELKRIFPNCNLSLKQAEAIVESRRRAMLYYTSEFKDIKYGSIGKFTIIPGRKEALDFKRELVGKGYSYNEANKMLRERLKELRKFRVNRTGKILEGVDESELNELLKNDDNDDNTGD